MDDRWDELRRIAGRQHGLLSTRQARDLGFDRSELRRTVERGQLGAPDIRLLATVEPEAWSHRGLLWAVQLSVRRLVVACAFSAAWCLGLLRKPPDQAWVMVRGKWAPERDDVRVLTCRNLPDEDIEEESSGLRRTTAARTIVDLAARLPVGTLRGVLLDARQRGLTDQDEVRRIAERRLGAAGVTGLLRVCDQVGADGADSALEADFRDRIATSSLPAPSPAQLVIPTHRGGTRRIDVAWPEHQVGAECDGLAYHGSRRAHDRDAVRRTELNLTTFRIVHVTWARVELGWPDLEADLWAAMRLGGRGRG